MGYSTPDAVFDAYVSSKNPHPRVLQMTAKYTILNKIRRFPQARNELEHDAANLLDLAERLEPGVDPHWQRAYVDYNLSRPLESRHSFQRLDAPGFIGTTIAEYPLKLGVQLRAYSLFEKPSGERSGRPHRVVARMMAVQHLRWLWEVIDVEVRSDARRKGAATALYDAAERFNQIPFLAPSGWLTEDALAFWEARRPGLKGYSRHPRISGIILSVKQLLMLKMAAEWRLADQKAPPFVKAAKVKAVRLEGDLAP